MKAKLVYPPPKQITYREYGADMVALMDVPKESLLRKYEETLEKKPRH